MLRPTIRRYEVDENDDIPQVKRINVLEHVKVIKPPIQKIKHFAFTYKFSSNPTIQNDIKKLLQQCLGICKSGTNRLMVTMNHVNKLNDSFLKNIMNKLSLREWYDIHNNPKILDLLFMNDRDLIKDQSIRAEKCLDIMIKEEKNTIIFMDGHGRFLYSILNAYYMNPKFQKMSLKIKIIEIDPYVDDWHKYYFPAEVETLYDNIIYYLYDRLSCNKTMSETFVYMNFCNLPDPSKSYYKITDNDLNDIEIRSTTYILITQLLRKCGTIMISYGLRHGGSARSLIIDHKFVWSIKLLRKKIEDLSEIGKITSRKCYGTYVLDKI